MLEQLEQFSRRFSNWLAMLGLIGLVALALMTIFGVMSRWLFSHPIEWLEDVYRLQIAIVVASFFPSAYAQRGHIAIHFLSLILPPAGRKGLAVFASFITFLFTIVLGWQFILYCIEVWETGETTWLLGINVTPWWMVATAFLLLSIPVQLIVVLSDLYHGPNGDGHGDGGGQGGGGEMAGRPAGESAV